MSRPQAADLSLAALAGRLQAHADGLHDQVVAKDARLQAQGSAAYLAGMGS